MDDESLCGAIIACRVKRLFSGGSMSFFDLDASTFPEAVGKIRRSQALYGQAKIRCDETVLTVHVISEPHPVIRVSLPL